MFRKSSLICYVIVVKNSYFPSFFIECDTPRTPHCQSAPHASVMGHLPDEGWGRYDTTHSETSCYPLWPQRAEIHCKDTSELSLSLTLLLGCPVSISLRLFLAFLTSRRETAQDTVIVCLTLWRGPATATSGFTTPDGPATDSCISAVCLSFLCSQGRKTGMLRIFSPTLRTRENHILKVTISHHCLWKSSRQPA